MTKVGRLFEAEKDAAIAEKDAELAKKDATIADKEAKIKELEALLAVQKCKNLQKHC